MESRGFTLSLVLARAVLPGFPFYGRAEMTALEPASCLPNDALLGASQAGRSKTIPVGQDLSFSVESEIM
jgi:hypothetical protein